MTDRPDEPVNDVPADESENTAASSSEAGGSAESENEAAPDELRARIADLEDRLLREQAEMENFRRRSSRDAMEAMKYQALPVVRDLLPVLDNLDRAIQAAEQTGDVARLLEGIRMVATQLKDTLRAHAAEPIEAEGQPFDPNLHEAVSQVATADCPPMTVVQVVETGYRMHDRVVRPAKVIVSCAPSDPAPDSGPSSESDTENNDHQE